MFKQHEKYSAGKVTLQEYSEYKQPEKSHWSRTLRTELDGFLILVEKKVYCLMEIPN